jgi:hypothetical protein
LVLRNLLGFEEREDESDEVCDEDTVGDDKENIIV